MIGAVDRPASAPFLRARLAALYLLSLASVDAAFLGWMPWVLESAAFRFLVPLGLAAAALGGAALNERLSILSERLGRSRFRAAGGTLHACVLTYAFLAVATAQRPAVEGGLQALAMLQPLFLLLAGAGRGAIGAVLNAAAMTALAAVAGGWGAAGGVTAHVPLLIVFLAADHLARTLTEYPVEEPPGWMLLAREAGGPAVLAGVLLGAFFAAVPATPYAALGPAPSAGTLDPGRLGELALQILGIAGLAAVAFYLLLRWGGGMRSAEAEAAVRRPSARRRAEAGVQTAAPSLPPPEGLRGRIVRFYLRLLEQLARRGLRRLRGQTPREFEPRLSPADAAAELTGLFMHARYGPDEPSPADVERMDAACRRVLE